MGFRMVVSLAEDVDGMLRRWNFIHRYEQAMCGKNHLGTVPLINKEKGRMNQGFLRFRPR